MSYLPDSIAKVVTYARRLSCLRRGYVDMDYYQRCSYELDAAIEDFQDLYRWHGWPEEKPEKSGYYLTVECDGLLLVCQYDHAAETWSCDSTPEYWHYISDNPIRQMSEDVRKG